MALEDKGGGGVQLKYFFFVGGNVSFLGAISLGRVVIPSPRIAINLPRTNKKLHCKGESYRFSD